MGDEGDKEYLLPQYKLWGVEIEGLKFTSPIFSLMCSKDPGTPESWRKPKNLQDTHGAACIHEWMVVDVLVSHMSYFYPQVWNTHYPR
jgi:hypothetical protein